MKIYQLTNLGRKMARSVSNPDTLGYRCIHYLDAHGAVTVEQVAGTLGVSVSDANYLLNRLKRNKPPVVIEG